MSSEAKRISERYSLDTTQTTTVLSLLDVDRQLLIAPKGAGKTRIGIAVASESEGRTLVICPNQVRGGWLKEAQRLDVPARLIEGAAAARKKALDEADELLLVLGVDLLPWLVDTYKARLPVSGLIIDETTRFSDPGATGVRKLRRCHSHVDWILGLTASPVMEDPIKLYAQARVIDGGRAYGRNFQRFKETWFWSTDFQGYNWELKPGVEEAFAKQAAGLVTVMEADSYEAGLPPLEDDTIYLPLNAIGQARYDEMLATLAVQMDSEEVEAPNAAVMTGKLQQITAGFIYTQRQVEKQGELVTVRGSALWHDRAKYEYLARLLAEEPDEPPVIVYQYEAELEMLRKYIPGGRDLKDDGAKAAFIAGDLPALFMHPKSGGHGVDGLQHATGWIIFLSPLWSADQWDQATGRVRRRGTEWESIRRTVFIVGGTIDVEVMDRCLGKQDTEARVMAHIRKKAAQRAA